MTSTPNTAPSTAPSTSTRPTVAFGDLVIEHDERVLTPRPWTALQSRWAVELLADAPEGPLLELCTGAGHIGLLAAVESGRRLVAVDLSPAACELVALNAARAGIVDRLEVREGRLDEVVGADERFPVVVADPPWVQSDAVGVFPEDPLLAIDGGPDGLEVAWACVAVAERHLLPGGSLLLQLGDDAQADRILHAHGVRHHLTDGGRREARVPGSGGVVLRLVQPAG